MEKTHWFCAAANSIYSVSLSGHRTLKVGREAASLQCVSWMGCFYKRHIHHSSELQRFYTNRLYKKRCSCCGRPNIIPVTDCGYCGKQLTDRDIHPVERDVLKELAASRTYLCKRGLLLRERADVRVLAPPGDVGKSRTKTICRKPDFLRDHQSSTLVKVNDYLHCIEEYHRSFDFLIIRYPFPIATVHLSAVMKGTAYDIKQLRPSHVPLLQQMQRQTVAVVEDILQACLCLQQNELFMERESRCTDASDEVVRRANTTPEEGGRVAAGGLRKTALRSDFNSTTACFKGVYQDHLSLWRGTKESQRVLTSSSTTSSSSKQLTKKAVEKMKACIIFGFTYPCEYNQVNMHAIVPPICNFNMLKAPFFLPLKKILHDLQESGSVQVNMRQAGSIT